MKKLKGKFIWVDAFSLALTLSRWEREQPLADFGNAGAVEQQTGVDLPESWKQFSLSRRERAGVREK
jgi:hypothetical protein